MKNLLFSCVIASFTLLTACNMGGGSGMDCAQFAEGTFAYDDPRYEGIIVERTKDTQTETNRAAGLQHTLSVEWIDDCEYVLTFVEVNNPDQQKHIGEKIHVKITEVGENRYKFTSDQDEHQKVHTMVRQ